MTHVSTVFVAARPLACSITLFLCMLMLGASGRNSVLVGQISLGQIAESGPLCVWRNSVLDTAARLCLGSSLHIDGK
jgi:hypothetical protein